MLVAPRLGIDLDAVTVLIEAVDERDDAGGAGEDRRPLLEGEVGADDGGALTEDRAAAVKQYLVGKGVSPDRLMSHGYGETKPLCKRHDEACWSKNRRVAFVILRRTDAP
jgi:OmpA family protein